MKRPTALVRSGLIAYAFVAALLASREIPFDRAPDEFLHMDLATTILRTGRFPSRMDPALVLGGKWSYAAMPPLAPLLQACSIWIALRGEPVPRVQGAGLHAMRLTESTATTALKAARLVSTLEGAATVWIAGRIGMILFPTSLPLQIWLPAAIALQPQFTFVSAYVNDDALAVLVAALVLWAALLGQLKGWNRQRALFLGISGGLLMLAKPNAWALAPALAWALLHTSQGRRRFPIVLGSALLIGGGWFLRNTVLYGDPMGLTTTIESGPTLASKGIGFLGLLFRTKWITMTFNSFWAQFDYMAVRLPNADYFVLYGIVALALISLVLALHRRFLRQPPSIEEIKPPGEALMTLLLAIAGVVGVAMVDSVHFDFQPQGRYLFPALVPIQVFLGLGLNALGGRRWGGLILFGMEAWLSYLSIASLALLHRTYL